MFSNTKMGRSIKAMNRGGSNKHYNIPSNLPLSASHIFVLLMYCNETILQYKYKKFGCRKMNENQTTEEFKAMNAEIGHWSNFLFQAIMFFGTRVTSKNVFYT